MYTLCTSTIVNNDRSNYSDDRHNCIGDLHISVTKSQCDTNLFAQIKTGIYIRAYVSMFGLTAVQIPPLLLVTRLLLFLGILFFEPFKELLSFELS